MTRRAAWTSTNTDTNSFTAAGDCGGHQRSVLDLDLEREDGDEWGGVIVSPVPHYRLSLLAGQIRF